MTTKQITFALLAALLLSFSQANCQETGNMLKEAEKLHNQYEFDKAVGIYTKLMGATQDSTASQGDADADALTRLLALSQNGSNMLKFAFEPEVVATKSTASDKFFLCYQGFGNGSWTFTPDEFTGDSAEKTYMYFPKNAGQVFFSAKDNSGSWNIYTSKLNDNGEWSYPEMLNENITSSGDELFPLLSADGESLYFSSNGHYGMGGFDIYVSHWDESTNDWGVAQNLGFPFSSPKDDFLYYDTPNGKYSVFASNRDSEEGRIKVYVLEFDNLPLKRSITPAQARSISHLKAEGELSGNGESENIGDGNNQNADGKSSIYAGYRKTVTALRGLQKEIDANIQKISSNRDLYNTLTNEADLKALEKKISEQEMKVLYMRDSLSKLTSAMQEIEMDFLAKGIMIPREEGDAAVKTTVKEGTNEYVFASNSLGETPQIVVESANPPAGISLEIGSKPSMIYEFSTLPKGLVYEYQLFIVSTPQNADRFKGITPIFERTNASKKHVYTAGIFATYADALANINKVKKHGFPNAVIVAFNNGETMSIANARVLEKKLKTAQGGSTSVKTTANARPASTAAKKAPGKKGDSYRISIVGYSESIAANVLKVIRDNTEKDIAKHTDNGVLKFSIGLFQSQTEANNLVELIRNEAADNIVVSIETVAAK